MESPSQPLLLRVPTPDCQGLSFCEPNTRDLKIWLAGLPKANLGETARLLYQAMRELNQLRTPTQNRLQLLELMRPEIHFIVVSWNAATCSTSLSFSASDRARSPVCARRCRITWPTATR